MKYRLDIPDAEVIEDPTELQELVDQLQKTRTLVAYDTETTGLEWTCGILMIQVAFVLNGRGRRILIPTMTVEQLFLFDILKPLFEDPECPLVAQNAPFDKRVMARHGIEVRGLIGDTMKMHHVFDEEERHGLKELASRFCGINLLSYKKIFGNRRVQAVYEDPATHARSVEYATLDAWATLEVFDVLKGLLSSQEWRPPKSICAIGVPDRDLTMWDQHTYLDIPFTEVLQNMESRGVLFDFDRLRQLAEPMDQDAAHISAKICEEYNTSINLNSPVQLSDFLFGELNLPWLKRTKSGYSTDKASMQNLVMQGHMIGKDVLDYRKIKKIKGTYVDGLINFGKESPDGRIHTTLRATTVTNRLRSSQPNLLNLPNAERDVYQIRSAVAAPPGYVLVCCDYSGLEMVLAAAMFGDEGLADAIMKGLDIHSMTAALVYKTSYDDMVAAKKAHDRDEYQTDLVNKRSAVKITGFGINYDISAPGLALQLTNVFGRPVNEEEAQGYIDLYYDARPGIYKGKQYYKKMLREQGSVYTLLGRKRTPSGARKSSYGDRMSAARQAINFPIQGTAADLIQLAMMQAENDPELKSLGARMILQIHDELLFETPEENAQRTLKRVTQIMENPRGWPGLPYDLPTRAEGGIGHNWAEAK